MKMPQNVAELQRERVVMELEGIDRMYLNAYVPRLTSAGGIAWFVRKHLGYRFGRPIWPPLSPRGDKLR